MNKLYFTKYIVVPEGKIKEGVRALLGKATITGIIDKQYLAEIKKNKKLADFKLVKLYICSRDIQVGDKVFPIDVYSGECYFWREFLKTNNVVQEIRPTDAQSLTKGKKLMIYLGADYEKKIKGNWFYQEEFFKVIGEVSPTATWVNEGDEFNKEDLFANGVGVNWNESYGKYIFTIKCPTCKTFH